MPENATIRRARAADVPALCQLASELVRQHVGYDAGRYQTPADLVGAYAELFAEHIGRAESVVVVAEHAGQIVGYAFGFVEPPSLVELAGRTGWIHDLYVAPSARALGAGGKLLDAAIAGLQALGVPGGVMLGVAPQNSAAAALFRKRGFRPALQEMILGPLPKDQPGQPDP